ncbi:MAG: hypothetical protein WBM05_05990 [Limnochordia bacterium]
MRRSLAVLLLCLLLSATAAASIHVFYLPESGFLRVSGEVILKPETASQSLLLFPEAHVTEFWADSLVEYSVERSAHGTAVIFALRELGPQTITFSYEGLVEPQLHEAVLGRDQLWLPEFTAPVEEWTVVLQLPEEWEVAAGEVVQLDAEGTFQLIHLAPSAGYPTVKLLSRAAALEELAQNGEAAAEPVEEEEAEAELPTESPRPTGIASRIQLQINRFTRALNQRSLTELSELLSPALREKGLAQYLASLPMYFGTVTSEVVQVPEDPSGTYVVVFSTERGPRYTAAMAWQETAGFLQMYHFHLTPAAPDVPQEIRDSCAQFVQDLQAALADQDRSALEALFAPDLRQDPAATADLLFALAEGAQWEIVQISLEPFAVIVVVPTGSTSLLLQLDLTPGLYHWLLKGLQIVPLP